jgi:F-type H+-transporting ATPase subunit gamma
METVDLLRRKIAVTAELQEVVKTMKTMAAVSIRQYEKAVEALRQFNRTIELGLMIVMRGRREENWRPLAPGGRLGAVIIGSELGMCGPFNDSLVGLALKRLAELQKEPSARAVVAVGARALARLEEEGEPVESHFDLPGSLNGITSRVQEILLKIEAWQCPGGVERIVLFHNRLVSPAAYRPREVALWPLSLEWLESLGRKPWPSRVLPTFTLARPRLLYALLGQYLFVSLYRAFAESLASENVARLAAMQVAESNIDDRLQALRLSYNQLRQSTITEELLDIVAGFETLTNADGAK